MGLFRKKPALPVRDIILDHTYEDEILDAAVGAVLEGELKPAITALAECRDQPEIRSLRVRVLAENLVGKAEALQDVGHSTGDPDVWLLAGVTFIEEAWAIRGTGRAKTVGTDRFKMFYATLRKAIGPLNVAGELLEKDAEPWSQLQTVAMGLQADRDQKDEIWREVIARCPTLYSAHYRRLQILATKWGGSQEEVLAFARGSVDTAPSGDPLAAMLPVAHFEVMLDGLNTAIDNNSALKLATIPTSYFRAVRAEIDTAADKWMMAIPRSHPRTLEAHNAFAAAYVLAEEPLRARAHLMGMRDHLHHLPWGYFSFGKDTIREEYLKAMAEYVLRPPRLTF
ncbi:MAG: hypothetical protein ABW215_04265 [Kibdelosporangium sp.]